MKKIKIPLLFIFVSAATLYSCETEEERHERLVNEQKEKLAEAKRKKQIAQEELARFQEEQQRIEQKLEAERTEKKRIEEEKRQKESQRQAQIDHYEKYINHSLKNGATPYSNCFGRNASCDYRGCSSIEVITSYGSDVLVTIKKGNRVVKHAYIRAGDSYTFQLPDGTYQPFFYYGRGWDPKKKMPSSSCSSLMGGFLERESFDKDLPQRLENQTLTYTLIKSENGNLRTINSDAHEAF